MSDHEHTSDVDMIDETGGRRLALPCDVSPMPFHLYGPNVPLVLADRTWADRQCTKAPEWASVDLRDGNQALVDPMDSERKLRLFTTLCAIGFKEIEVGFPSASQTDYDFQREIIDGGLIPEDVTIQVLTQCRPELIERTFESLRGARRAVVHFYNSTSTLQRRVVFGLDRQGIIDIAVDAARLCLEHESSIPDTEIFYEYSPESFTGTEPEFAIEICEAVMDVLQPTPARPLIINLPNTVEMYGPQVYADVIEWFARTIKNRESIRLSVHPHNDRGTAVAAAELAVLAGADRVEGTLFGNGERTGNLDVVTVALNLHTHGIDTGLNFSNLAHIREVYERCTRMEVPPRQPYAGDLVFTAFSGSHQDAIKKSWPHQKSGRPWDVIYIPIDPADLGRTYKAIIRINSQSGKGGVAYILETEFGYQLPKLMHKEIGKIVNDLADREGKELAPAEILAAFEREYLEQPAAPVSLQAFRTTERGERVSCEAALTVRGKPVALTGQGNGPIDAFMRGLATTGQVPACDVQSYNEHSLGGGAEARAVSYIQLKFADGRSLYGAGVDTNIEVASIRAIISALNRALA